MDQKHIVPRCEQHPDVEMTVGVARFFDDGESEPYFEERAYRCSKPSCKKFFSRSLGYQTQRQTLQENPVRCDRHSVFMMVVPDSMLMMVVPAGMQDFHYVCPTEGCTEVKPYPK